MARKKAEPIPFFRAWNDAKDAGDNFVQKSLRLHQMVVTALELKAIDPKIADRLQAAADEWEAAAMSKSD